MNALYKWRGFILGTMGLALVLFPATPLEPRAGKIVVAMAATLLLAGILLRGLARMSIGEHTRGSVHDAPDLVTTGMYSLVRHPLYLSNTLIACAAILFHLGFSWVAIPFVTAILLLEFILAKTEDRFLKRRFGDRWNNWAGETWAFLPNPFHFKPSKVYRSFFSAIRADASTWIWIIFVVFVLCLIR